MPSRSDDDDLLIALRHPLRRRILGRMIDGEETSPRDLSVALREPISMVSYHVRVLYKRSAIVLTRQVPVRGTVQHFYRNAVEAPWALQILRLEFGELGPGEEAEEPEP